MNGIIIYKSNYGTTKQYAQWLSEETGFLYVSSGSVKNADISDKDAVIIGCPVFANRPLLAKWIQKKWNVLQGKKVVLYTTSGTAPEDPALQKGFSASFPDGIRDGISYFPQGGRMVFKELKPMHKFFMNLGMKMEKDPKVREEMGKDKDGVDRKGIEAIVKFVK